MKVKKNIKALLMTSLVLFSSIGTACADDIYNANGYFTDHANLLEIKAWSETKEDGESFSTTGLKSRDHQTIKTAKNKSGENIILHNNGEPIETNMFEEKQGNELYAIVVNNMNGIEQKTYYFAQNADDYEMDELLERIDEGELENRKVKQIKFNSVNTKSSLSPQYIENFKWDFFAYGDNDGVKRQQGSLATSLAFDRQSNNIKINGISGSVWDVASFSQMLSRSTGGIRNHKTRLDVNYTNQTLYSWGPKDSGGSSAQVSLSGLVNPQNWAFALNGFSTDDLSNKGSKYGRWEYKPGLVMPTKMNTEPGIRATNTKGNFGVKLSHTATIRTQYTQSDHGTGVLTNFVPDR